MNSNAISESLRRLVHTYASGLSVSAPQASRLRVKFPDAIDPEVYDVLVQRDDPEEIVASSGTHASDGSDESSTVSRDAREIAAAFRHSFSSWRTAISPSPVQDRVGWGGIPHLFGSIWSVNLPKGEGWDGCVPGSLPNVVLAETIDSDNDPSALIQVFPLSLWPELASVGDLIVHNPPLPAPMMVEVWNEQPMLRTQLFRCLGALAHGDLESLAQMACAVRAGTPAGTSVQREAMVGDDPRRVFRQIELLRTMALRIPALEWLSRPAGDTVIDLTEFLARPADVTMAAASRDPERELWSVLLASESPLVRLAVSECVSAGRIALEVLSDPVNAMPGSTVVDDDGACLGTIPDKGAALQIERPSSGRIRIRMVAGEFLVLREIED